MVLKHYLLYMISNTNDLHFEYICKHFPIASHFNGYFPSHVVGHRKPDQAMFEHVIREIKLRPEETVFVDDIAEFVESAKHLGIYGIQFTTREALEAELRHLGIKF